jgi:hypothetical protein
MMTDIHNNSGTSPAAELSYAKPDLPAPSRTLSPAELRRRQRIAAVRRRIAILLLPLLAALIYVLFMGDNRWRVRYHHGVYPPPSARDFHCQGATAFPFMLDGHSSARFTIDPAELPKFLSQFEEMKSVPVAGGGTMTISNGKSPPAGPKGDTGGLSPTGRDYYSLQWWTTESGVVIQLDTSWN